VRLKTLLLVIALGVGCGAKSAPSDPAPGAIAWAARWLWARQAADGGWHSETYGLLRTGQSLTPFVLGALLEVPPEIASPPAGGVDRALRFIQSHVDPEGALGRADPLLEDYPNYATSLGIRTLVRAGKTGGIDRMIADLRREQFVEEQEWPKEHPAYGAWGMGGPPRRPPHTGHLDLSMTRHVLEGLAAAGLKSEDPALVRARVFLERCQNPDGGFFFSTVITDANKAGEEGGRPRSYGTATADGILSLLATGAGVSHPRVRAAAEWLVTHHDLGRVPGFPADFPKAWSAGMIHYYLAASARVFRQLAIQEAPKGHPWAREMATALLARQQPDGSFKNSNFLMKEDDPLLATAFSLTALVLSH
jgi:squalene-hopene/tetraprenyl-beta-curcumene cyclase